MAFPWDPRSLLNVDPSSPGFTCVGTTLKGLRCGQRFISNADLSEASQILNTMTLYHPESRTVQDMLADLAHLTLCPLWHRKPGYSQVTKMVQEWQRRIEFHMISTAVLRDPATPMRRPAATTRSGRSIAPSPSEYNGVRRALLPAPETVIDESLASSAPRRFNMPPLRPAGPSTPPASSQRYPAVTTTTPLPLPSPEIFSGLPTPPATPTPRYNALAIVVSRHNVSSPRPPPQNNPPAVAISPSSASPPRPSPQNSTPAVAVSLNNASSPRSPTQNNVSTLAVSSNNANTPQPPTQTNSPAIAMSSNGASSPPSPARDNAPAAAVSPNNTGSSRPPAQNSAPATVTSPNSANSAHSSPQNNVSAILVSLNAADTSRSPPQSNTSAVAVSPNNINAPHSPRANSASPITPVTPSTPSTPSTSATVQTPCSQPHSARRKPVTDCCICYEPICCPDDAVWCRAQCGQNVHRECFRNWRQHSLREARERRMDTRGGEEDLMRMVNCVFCRQRWRWEWED